MYVVDGGSTDSFVQRAISIGAKVFPQEGRGISRGQQQAISHAKINSDPDNYILIEPEKAGLIKSFFSAITGDVRDGLADLVVVGRTSISMETLPPMQRYTEKAINEIWKTLTGKQEDICFAPRVFNKQALKYFLDYTPTKNWDLFHGPRIDAGKAGLRVKPVKIEYHYHGIMRGQETGNLTFDKKRIAQLQEVTTFLEEYLKR